MTWLPERSKGQTIDELLDAILARIENEFAWEGLGHA